MVFLEYEANISVYNVSNNSEDVNVDLVLIQYIIDLFCVHTKYVLLT